MTSVDKSALEVVPGVAGFCDPASPQRPVKMSVLPCGRQGSGPLRAALQVSLLPAVLVVALAPGWVKGANAAGSAWRGVGPAGCTDSNDNEAGNVLKTIPDRLKG